MKFTTAFFALPLLAVQVLAVAVTPNENVVVKRSPVQKRQFKSKLDCSKLAECTATCNVLIPEIEKCTWTMEGTTRQGTNNIKCLCTPTFIAAAVANYNCEIPTRFSNFQAFDPSRTGPPKIDFVYAKGMIDAHITQCKALGIDLSVGLPTLNDDQFRLTREKFFPGDFK